MGIFDFIKKNKSNEKKTKIKKRVSGDLIFKDEMQKWIDENYFLFQNEYSYYDNNCCPNCGIVLNANILKSKKCPECKKRINVRTNRETGKKLLLTDLEITKFEKDNLKRKDILFYEKWLKALNNMYPNYMYYFWNLKKSKPDMSARDYAWSFENWLFNKLDDETVKKYQQHLKLNFQDRVLECDMDVFKLTHNSNVYRYMIEIAKYKEQYDVMQEMMLSLIYRSVTLAHLYYYHWEDRPFSEIQFYSDASFGMNFIHFYLEKYNLKFEDLKEPFMERAHPFIINILSKEKAWPILCEAYKRYVYLLKSNKFYGEK